jgi:REP element-mobilizing transposase RayT
MDEFVRLGSEKICENLAFVVMPDHFHWLVQLADETSLSEVVRLLKGRSARVLNQGQVSTKRAWQPGFHDHAVRREEDIEALANYLIQNPLRAGLVESRDEYPFWWSVWHPRTGCRG